VSEWELRRTEGNSAPTLPHVGTWRAHFDAVVSVEHVAWADAELLLTAAEDGLALLWTAEGALVGRFGQAAPWLATDSTTFRDRRTRLRRGRQGVKAATAASPPPQAPPGPTAALAPWRGSHVESLLNHDCEAASSDAAAALAAVQRAVEAKVQEQKSEVPSARRRTTITLSKAAVPLQRASSNDSAGVASEGTAAEQPIDALHLAASPALLDQLGAKRFSFLLPAADAPVSDSAASPAGPASPASALAATAQTSAPAMLAAAAEPSPGPHASRRASLGPPRLRVQQIDWVPFENRGGPEAGDEVDAALEGVYTPRSRAFAERSLKEGGRRCPSASSVARP
jgi:hypothetical protein